MKIKQKLNNLLIKVQEITKVIAISKVNLSSISKFFFREKRKITISEGIKGLDLGAGMVFYQLNF